MSRGLGWFFLGILTGVVGTLVFERLREERDGDDVDSLSESISQRLEALESDALVSRN